MWESVRRFPGDPWNRVSAEMDGFSAASADAGGAQTEVDEGNWAREFAGVLSSPSHAIPELQAFQYAWSGAIDWQRSMGNSQLADSAMPLRELVQWFARLAVATATLGSALGRQSETQQ